MAVYNLSEILPVRSLWQIHLTCQICSIKDAGVILHLELINKGPWQSMAVYQMQCSRRQPAWALGQPALSI